MFILESVKWTTLSFENSLCISHTIIPLSDICFYFLFQSVTCLYPVNMVLFRINFMILVKLIMV